MAYRNGPKIITDNMLCYLDINSTTCYTSGSNIMNNLVGEGYYTLFGDYSLDTTDNINSILFTGSNGCYSEDSDSSRSSFGTSSFTLSWWLKPFDFVSLDNASFGRLCEKSGYPNDYFLVQFLATGTTVNFSGKSSTLSATDITWGGTTSTYDATLWHLLTVVLDVDKLRYFIYINNELKDSNTINSSYYSMESTSVFRFPSTYAELGTYVNMFMMYDKALSHSEVIQNYNSTKRRFGY